MITFNLCKFEMKILILLYVTTVSTESKSAITNNSCAKEIIKSDIQNPYQLTIDYKTNHVFFSYHSKHKKEIFRSAHIDLNTYTYTDIKGIRGGFASAVDQRKHKVYLGGNDGVYKFNYKINTAKHTGNEREHSIWQMYFKNKLYYTTFLPTEKLYTFKKGNSSEISKYSVNKIKLIVFDNEDTAFIANDNGLFAYKINDKERIEFGSQYNNINSFTTDRNGEVYFSTPDGIHFINRRNRIVEKITDIKHCYGVAIAQDGTIVYADLNKIGKLNRTDERCRAKGLI